MYGDGAHKKLLDNGWRWNGEWYEKSYANIAAELRLAPIRAEKRATQERRGVWVIRVTTPQGSAEIARYPNMNTAAMAAVGVE